MKKRILIVIELLAATVVILALATHPATDQTWLSYLLNLAKRLNPFW